MTDPAARSAYLDGACGGDAGLRSRVEALLRAHDGHDSLLDQPTLARPAHDPPPAPPPPPPPPRPAGGGGGRAAPRRGAARVPVAGHPRRLARPDRALRGA